MAIRRNTHTLVGEIKDYSGGSVEFGFLLTDGASYPTATYPKLFAKIGYTYGGAGPNFNVPDWRGRVSAGKDDMGGTPANRLTAAGSGINGTTLGAAGGAETHALNITEIPSHDHGGGNHAHNYQNLDTYVPSAIGAADGANKPAITSSTSASGNIISAQGGNGSHQNTQPTMVALKMIAYL